MPLVTFSPTDLPKLRGFTLIEVIVAVIILGFLATIGTSMIYSGFMAGSYVIAENAAVASGRYALERISREMRESDKNTVQLGASQMGWMRTRDGVQIPTYVKYDSVLQRVTMSESSSGPDYILASDVVKFDCEYVFPDPANPSAGITPVPNCNSQPNPDPTRLSKVTLILEIKPIDSPKVSMKKVVVLRNQIS